MAKNDLLLSTQKGLSIRFGESGVRSQGRSAHGVRGIRLKENDALVSMEVIENGASLLVVTENGYGKRTDIAEYRRQARGGSGIITVKVDARNGRVTSAMQVEDQDEIMIITNLGKLIRMATSDISIIGRNTKGVRLISVDHGKNEKVQSLVHIKEEQEEQE